MTTDEIIHELYACVPFGSSEPTDARTITRLRTLTSALLEAYELAGHLERHPFSDAVSRCLQQDHDRLKSCLANKTILITGGEGTVGRQLISALARFSPAQLVSVDVAVPDHAACSTCVRHQIDIADRDWLAEVFQRYTPDLVFHLAASREPAHAEQYPKTAVCANVIGTRNVLDLCRAFDVRQCVQASTGKAARLYPADVYAASKKVGEWQLLHAAHTCACAFTAVRFTHIIENSIVARETREKIHAGLVSFHSHDRYVFLQSLNEAVALLLNALVIGQPRPASILTVRDLGWPVEVLRLPLYLMKIYGIAPLWFRGVPAGYESDLFRGQLDWDHLDEFGPMINALETLSAETDPTREMTIAPLVMCAQRPLEELLATLERLIDDQHSSDADVRDVLAMGVESISGSSFEHVPVDVLWRVLQTGIDLRGQDVDALVSSHAPTISLIARAVAQHEERAGLAAAVAQTERMTDVLSVLRKIENRDSTIALLLAICHNQAHG